MFSVNISENIEINGGKRSALTPPLEDAIVIFWLYSFSGFSPHINTDLNKKNPETW